MDSSLPMPAVERLPQPKRSRPQRADRPPRPADCPLFPHAAGQWAKKVRGRTRYFGPWHDVELALARWNAWKDDLLAGRPIRRIDANEITLKELANDFLTTKKALANEGQITERTWDEYLAACRRVCAVLGKDTPAVSLVPADFEKLRAALAKSWGPVRVGNEIRRIRTMFTYGLAHNLIERLPLYGTSFKKPSKLVLRKARAAKGLRMFQSHEIQHLLAAAGPTMRAMILLGVNCGLGNTDVAGLQKKHLDLKGGWISYPRQKTGVDRKAKLWPETVAAIRSVLKRRKRQREKLKPEGSESQRSLRRLIFVTKAGRSWKPRKSGNPISMEMLALTQRLKIWRPGLGFYALRHTFETVGGEAGDQAAVDHVMGHPARSGDMSAVYRERMLDARLEKVANHVHAWLWPEERANEEQSPT